MSDTQGITTFQSFSDRTLRYGRNVMVAVVPMIVLGWVPMVDLANSKPMNFDFQEGGEVWLWRLLFAVLLYYGGRFAVLAVLDYLHWRDTQLGRIGNNMETLDQWVTKSANYEMNLIVARQEFKELGDPGGGRNEEIQTHEGHLKEAEENVENGVETGLNTSGAAPTSG